MYNRSKHRLSETACQRFLQQLASAMAYLRERNVGHFDLKPENVLLLSRRNPVIKLGDFGLAQHLPESGDLSAVIGSPLYMAPEILLKKKYDSKVDLWSVGVILYECLFGKAPFSSSSYDELVKKIMSDEKIVLPPNSSISTKCKDLLIRCLQRDPDERISFEDFFAHPFIDLEHAPLAESIDKSRKLLEKAVSSDENKEYTEALEYYTESLRYLVPLIYVESDVVKRGKLRKSAKSYLKRTDELNKLIGGDTESDTKSNIPQLPSEPSMEEDSIDIKQASFVKSYQDLVKMSAATPGIIDALDIARSGDSYVREGSYSNALEKYELSLGMLMKILANEPHGQRRTLLSTIINYWMTKAEDVKTHISEPNAFSKSQRKSKIKNTKSNDHETVEKVDSSDGSRNADEILSEKDYEDKCCVQ